MVSRLLSLLLAGFLIPGPALAALDPEKALTQYVREIWKSEQGLPQNSVYAMAQSREGYLWMGTAEGLVRFDGARFTVFDPRNLPGLAHKWASALMEDRAGRLWIGTQTGLTCLETGHARRFGREEGLPSEEIRALAEDRRGDLWVGTAAGLARLTGGRLHAEHLLGKEVRALLADGEGRLWIGTGAGLFLLENGTLRAWTEKEGLAAGRISALCRDRAGNLWVGTQHGLRRLREGRILPFPHERELQQQDVRALLEDREGNLWIGTYGGGLMRWREGELSALTQRQGLSDDFILALHEDREGSLWIGTWEGGLSRLRNASFTTLGIAEGLGRDHVRSLHEDPKGALWIGTSKGLYRMVDGRPAAFAGQEAFAQAYVHALLPDGKGGLWVGTLGHGAKHLGASGASAPPELAKLAVRTLLGRRDGGLWIGSETGLKQLKEGRLTDLPLGAGASSLIVQTLLEGRDGSLWIGTYGGLHRMKEGHIVPFAGEEALARELIFCLHEDPDGALWIGTYGGGLKRLKEGALASLSMPQGLFDDVIYSFLEDDAGQCWISCNKGVFRVSKRELEEVVSGRRERVQSLAFGPFDGMRSAECNSGSPAAIRTRDGRFWFATIGGAVAVDPARLVRNDLPPPVVIEERLVDGQVAALGPLRLSPGSKALELHYTALSLRVPQRVRFKVLLEGFDKDWIDAGTRRTAYYTNLPHGAYRFRVQACNDDGVWNEAGAALPLEVLPRLHERLGVRLLALLATLLALWGLLRWRLRKVEREKRILEFKVRERTAHLERLNIIVERARASAEAATQAKSVFLADMSHELRTPLNAILLYSELIHQDAEDTGTKELARDSGNILSAGRHLLSLVNDILDLSKVEAGKMTVSLEEVGLRALLEEVALTLGPLARERADELVLELPDPDLVWRSDALKLRQVLINLASNAIKFTSSGQVFLRAWTEDEELRLEVRDTGVGMNPDQAARVFHAYEQPTQESGHKAGGTGLGLTITRKFVELLKGSIDVESLPGQGTTFRVHLPQLPL